MWAVPSASFLELPGKPCLGTSTLALRPSAPHYNLARGHSRLHFTDVQMEALELRWAIQNPTLPFADHPGGSIKPLVHNLVDGSICLCVWVQEGQWGLRRSSVVEVRKPSTRLGPRLSPGSLGKNQRVQCPQATAESLKTTSTAPCFRSPIANQTLNAISIEPECRSFHPPVVAPEKSLDHRG